MCVFILAEDFADIFSVNNHLEATFLYSFLAFTLGVPHVHDVMFRGGVRRGASVLLFLILYFLIHSN